MPLNRNGIKSLPTGEPRSQGGKEGLGHSPGQDFVQPRSPRDGTYLKSARLAFPFQGGGAVAQHRD